MNNSGWLIYALAFLATLISCQGHRIDYEKYTSRGSDDGRILLIARAEGIRVFTVGTNATSILRAPHRSDGVSFDAKTGKIYWVTHSYNNQQEGGIYNANLDGSNSTMLVSTKALGGQRVVRVAYDWIAGNLYYTDIVTNRIGVCDGAGQKFAVLLQGEGKVSAPLGIALYPAIGRMFWVNAGSVYGAGMDGTDPKLVLRLGATSRPNGISVDFPGGRLYWADDKGTIESCTLDGADHYVIANPRNGRPAGIDVVGDHLYWGGINGKMVWRLTKRFSSNATSAVLVHSGGDEVHSIAVYDSAKQPKHRVNSCENSGCSGLCVLSGKDSFRCL